MSRSTTIADISHELKIQFTPHQKKLLENAILSKKKLYDYASPSTNKQVSSILRSNKPAVYYRLCQLICKFAKVRNFSRVIYELLKRDISDLEIYQSIFRISSQKYIGGASGEFVAVYFLNILSNFNIKPKSLLDIGCGNCLLTRDLGNIAGMSQEDVYGADILEEFEKNWVSQRPRELNFVEIKDNKLRFDRKFDLITCFMVLHHVLVDVVDQYITDIHKLLNHNGVFLIKEHDCLNAIDYMIADVEHSLYIAQESLTNHREIPDQAKKRIFEQNIHYKSRFEWRAMIQKAGFECIYEEPFDIGLSGNYTPSRGYIALFKKI